MLKKFQRTTENFICEKCAAYVSGSGYTNHCPQCLWSKHVDVNPGDRRSQCGGAMKPVAIRKKARGWIIKHKCEVCGLEKNNKLADGDNFEVAIKISKTRC